MIKQDTHNNHCGQGLRRELNDQIDRKFTVVDHIIEHSIYAYFFLIFLAKGEGIRNLLLFGSFMLWAATARQRKNLHLLKEPVPVLLWLYLAATLISAIFSIDPIYSLLELKGEILKFGLLFPVVATVMADEKRLINVMRVSLFSMVVIVAAGYYSYVLNYNTMEMLKPVTTLVHIWHNRFARYLCILIPLSSILYSVWREPVRKTALTIIIFFSIIALILSTSRGGIAGFVSIVIIWSIYFSRTKGYKLKKILMPVTAAALIVGVFSYIFFEPVNTRINHLPRDLSTFNERTVLWKASLSASMKRPLTGWGYGSRIFHYDEPFKDTVYGKALETDKDPHNIFLKILFHQGILGLFTYAALMITALKVFASKALKTRDIRSYVLIACASIIFGNYILHSMLTNVRMAQLSFILGLGMAAKGISENSDT